MIEIKKANSEKKDKILKDYCNNLSVAMDDMWEEGIIPLCDFYEIEENDLNGYFAIDDEKSMLLFYVNNNSEYNKTLSYIINKMKISKAYVASYDHLFTNACKKMKAEFNENTLLYTYHKKIDAISPIADIKIREANTSELENVLNYAKEKVGLEGEWLNSYYKKLIHKRGLILFLLNNEVIASGEIRPSISKTKYANVGMMVALNYRQKGLGFFIMCTISKMASDKGYNTICSTTIDNVASQKTLVKSGYRCYHKIYTVNF